MTRSSPQTTVHNAERAAGQAAIITAPRTVSVQPQSPLTPGEGEVVVRIEGCGVCASSIPVWEGRDWFSYPLAPGEPGHEAWGVVQEVGAGVDTPRVGDRVAVISERAFATHDVALAHACVVLPEELQSMPFPGEPLGCAANIFRRSGIRRGDTVAVVGAGFIGTLLIQLARSAQARVIAISSRETSLDAAREAGAHDIIPLADRQSVTQQVHELIGERGCDVVIEATGKQKPLDLAAELCRVRGRLVIAGYHQDGRRTVDMQMWNWRGLDVINAHERDPAVFAEGVRLAIQACLVGHMDPRPLLTHTYPLARLDEALDAAATRPSGFMKAIVTMPPAGEPASDTNGGSP